MSKERVIHIRKARPDDAVRVMKILREELAEADLNLPEPEDGPALIWIISVIAQGFVMVAEMSGRIVGSIGLSAQTFPWAPSAWFMGWSWFFVLKGFREGGTAVQLAKRMNALADEKGAKIVGTVMTAHQPELKDRLVKMLGFTYCGGYFARGFTKVEPAESSGEEEAA